MKVKLYLFPRYIDINGARSSSPELFNFLDCERVDFQVECWDGALNSIPTDATIPVIIQASHIMGCSTKDLAELCTKLGHLIIYHDGIILPDGTIDWAHPTDELVKFLDRVAKKSF